MNNAMNIQKVFSPISPAQRVRSLKKEHPDSQKRRFERDLEEKKDDEKDEKQGAPTLEMTSANNEKGKEEERNFKKESSDPGVDIEKQNSRDIVGTLVDIRV